MLGCIRKPSKIIQFWGDFDCDEIPSSDCEGLKVDLSSNIIMRLSQLTKESQLQGLPASPSLRSLFFYAFMKQ